MWTAVADELRWGFRYLRRRPSFTAAVVTTLALSIAAATTAFGIARAVLWRPLPFDDASRLVFVWEEVERDGQRHPSRVTGSRYAAWRDTPDHGFRSIALFGSAGFTIDSPSGARTVRGVRVSAGYFDTLGIRPLLGRGIAAGDDVPGRHQVVVLSHAFWQQHFSGRREVVGESLVLSGRSHVIVGVMPPVAFPAWPVNPATVTIEEDSRQLWVPIPRTPELDQSARAHVFGVLGRLADGVSAAQAGERLVRATDPAAADAHGAVLSDLRDQFVRETRTPLWTLMLAALAALLIACANLASLYAARFEGRRGELAVRAALGAGLSRLARQLAIETSVLAGAGAVAGIALARMALVAIPRALPPSIPFVTLPALDLAVAAFAVLLAIVATMTLTAWPMMRLIKTAPAPRGVAAPVRARVYHGLVAAQVGVTTALVVAAALLAQSLSAVTRQDAGFDIADVLVADIGFQAPSAPQPARLVADERRLLSAIAAMPQVRAVATAYDHPLEANWSEAPTVVGDAVATDERRQAELRIVSPGYFEALGVTALDGRTFTDRDAFDAPGVAVVNEAFAREIGGRVLGRRIRSGTPRFMYGDAAANEFAVVGVVQNERFRGLEQPVQPAFYLSTRQFPQSGVVLLVRTAGNPDAAASEVRAMVRAVDRTITFTKPTSLAGILDEQLAPRRVTASTIGVFAAAALALAALGLYGLLGMLVASHSREIGVRLALGAAPGDVARRVFRDAVQIAAIGVAVGCVLAIGAGRLVAALLVGVGANDPLTLATVVATLFGVALMAAAGPAFRASRIDPVDALRAE